MSACVVCKRKKGKINCGCLCDGATVHKQCIVNLASNLYERKTDTCESCNVKISCVKPLHFTQAAREKLICRLRFSGISFGKTGMVPSVYTREGPNLSDMNKQKMQQTWSNTVDEELKTCPDFVEKALKTAKKRKVSFCFSGCKWD